MQPRQAPSLSNKMDPVIDPRSNPERPMSTPDRIHIHRGSTPERSRIGPKSTPDRPRFDPRSATHRSQVGPRVFQDRDKINPRPAPRHRSDPRSISDPSKIDIMKKDVAFDAAMLLSELGYPSISTTLRTDNSAAKASTEVSLFMP